MDIKVLKTDILSFNVPNFLIFVDGEHALVKQYIDQIALTVGKRPKYFYDIDFAVKELEDSTDNNVLYIVGGQVEKFDYTKYIEYFKEDKSNNIILLIPSVERSAPWYKNNKDFFVFFEKLDRITLLAYSMKLCKKYKCSVSQERLLSLIDKCDCNLGIILNELDKIFVLGQENSNTVFDYMSKSGFSDYRKVNVYDFVNRLLNMDESVLRDLHRIDEQPVSVLTLIYNVSKKRMESSNNSRYIKVMEICNNMCQGIVDGTIDAQYALKFAIMEILL